MNFTVITVEQFEHLVSDISKIKEALLNRPEEDFSSLYLESKKIPTLLGISQKTWQTYRDKGTIPFIQFGSKIWVKRVDIETFLNDNYIKKTGGVKC